ncbi:MAG: ABC transporter ATP-binding protein [Gemmatimonadales bacterium]
MPMLIARNLTKVYQSGGQPLTVLREVSLEVEPGGFLAVVGPSGCGKTTLLGLLAGLDVPTSGSVVLDGADLSTLGEDQRAQVRADKVGFVFQTFQLIPTLTAQENVQVPIELGAHGDGHGAPARAKELLRRVGLTGREHHYPAQLSGGEQQRVAIARAFANEPRILFADEPTGNLDAETGGRIVDLLVQLNRELKTTLVLVTHDTDLANHAQHVLQLKNGSAVAPLTSRLAPQS